jgi:hypothetical protein
MASVTGRAADADAGRAAADNHLVEELDARASPCRCLLDRSSERPLTGHDGDHVSALRRALSQGPLRDVRVRAPGIAGADDRPRAGLIRTALYPGRVRCPRACAGSTKNP